ncbi:MAG: hypothetical protein ACREJC_03150, partial [Tepidisphaeraceae bacterium]
MAKRKRTIPARRVGARRRLAGLLEALEPRTLMTRTVSPFAPRADGAPIAQLYAPARTQSGEESYWFRVIYRDDAGVRASSLDNYDVRVYGPSGFERFARLITVEEGVSGKTVSGRYKISPPGGSWDADDDGTYTVMLRPRQVRDTAGVFARDGIIGQFQLQTETDAVAGVPTQQPSSIQRGINAADFGVIANDGLDDTVAIQAAVDWMIFYYGADGVPVGNHPAGGTINLPAGTLNTSAPIRISSGIWLRGADSGTAIQNSSTNRTRGAVEFFTPYSHGTCGSAAVINLSIYGNYCKGIAIDPTMPYDLIDAQISNVKISTGGVGIELRTNFIYFTTISDVTITNPGSTALAIGTPTFSAVNRVENLKVEGKARSNFRPEEGVVVIRGDTVVLNTSIKVTGATTVPLFVTGTATFAGLTLDVPAADCPDGILAEVNQAWRVSFDSLSGLSATRKLKVVGAKDVNVGVLGTTGGATLEQVSEVDEDSHLSVGGGAPGKVPVAKSTYTAPSRVFFASDYGAVPNDHLDDTAAIQAALTAARIAGGGIVQLALGHFDTTGRLRVYSNVWLRGGGFGSFIYNLGPDAHHGAIELMGPAGSNNAAVMDLSLYTETAKGILADPAMGGALIDAQLVNLRLCNGGMGIDLRNVDSQNVTVSNVMNYSPGSSALWLGRAGGNNVRNRVENVRLIGPGRSNFKMDKALIVLYGDTTVLGGSIEEVFATSLPLYVSGKATINGLWTEYRAEYLPDRVEVQFENATDVYFDRMMNIDYDKIVKLTNSPNVRIGWMGIYGTNSTNLRDVLNVDDTSRLKVGSVDSIFDSGMFDHPRVGVGGCFNETDKTYVENKVPTLAENLLLDPLITSVGTSGTPWQMIWGDSLGAVVGTVSVEQTPSGPRLKIVVTSNVNNRDISI